ncbi:MAG: phosphate ABC transporter permease PstA [Actinobacteria bacterium]|nr:phosphate ABC transporter permease PstA [Actinomycetota bacterium]
MSQTMIINTPQKPWKLTPKQLLPDLLGAIFTVAATFAIVAISPLKGKLGFALTLITMSILVSTAVSWIRQDRKAAMNSTTTVLVYIAAAFVIIPLTSVLYEIVRLGAPSLSFNMFTNDMSQTASEAPLTEGGLLHAVVGTAYIVTFATLLSTPIGILTALYIVEVKGRFAGLVRFFVQAMSGVPSIVAGLFIFAVWMIQLGNSYSGLAGGLALTVLMIPTVARTSEEVLKLIPADLREAGLALGATQWRTVAMVVIPAAKSGLITAVILGIARVVGETAPLLLTLGGADALNLNPTQGNMSAFPYYVWKNLLLGSENAVSRAWQGVFILMVLVLIFFALARYFGAAKGAPK